MCIVINLHTFLLQDCLISSTSSSLLSISFEWVWRERSISISKRSLALKKEHSHCKLCSHHGLKAYCFTLCWFSTLFPYIIHRSRMSTTFSVVLYTANKLWHVLIVADERGVQLRKLLLSPFLLGASLQLSLLVKFRRALYTEKQWSCKTYSMQDQSSNTWTDKYIM